MCLAISISAGAQDSLHVEEPQDIDPSEIFDSPTLKPSIGFGLGTMAFFGELGNGNSANNLFTSSAAYSFHAKLPMSSSLDLTFTGIKSTLTVNNPGLQVLNNFRSEITGGSAILTYNFNSFLNKDAFWRPFIGTGISSFEFLSKADLYAADGSKYYLWSNGALMSMDENAPNAHEAMPLERDYFYESDLRSLNTEEGEPYSDFTISLPLRAGLDFKFSEHFKASLESTMYFTLTDNVDNVSSESESAFTRDKFVHTSLGFSYDLSFKTKNKKSYEEIEFDEDEGELFTEEFDSDGDGVHDLDDDDLGHPEGVRVDARGVPLDEDQDGVPDYRDDEPMTPDSVLVDVYGVTLEDQDLLDKYIVWIDSLGGQTLYSRVFGDKPEDNYAVLIIPEKDGFSQTQINAILSEQDLRVGGEGTNGNYVVGDYDNFLQAFDKKNDLKQDGINGSVTKEGRNGELKILTEEEENRLAEFARNSGKPRPVYEDISSDQVVYRVQVGAFRYDLSKNIFRNIDDLIILQGDDGLTRYMSSSYESAEEAAKRRVDLLTQGFEGSFITAYQYGKRISLSEAGLNVVPGAQDLVVDQENNSIKKTDIKFRICLGEYEGEIPTAHLDELLKLENVKPEERGTNTRFMSEEFDSLEAAQSFISNLKGSGLTDSKIIGSFNGKEITLEEALKILGQQ